MEKQHVQDFEVAFLPFNFAWRYEKPFPRNLPQSLRVKKVPSAGPERWPIPRERLKVLFVCEIRKLPELYIG